MRMTIKLDPTTSERLRHLAERERRRPQDQAVVILERTLEAGEAPKLEPARAPA